MSSWPDRVFCDTSFFFACLEARDAHHATALQWLEASHHRQSAYWTTWEIISETVTLLRRKSGYRRALDFVDEVVPTLHILSSDESVRDETLRVFRRFARDKKLSFCDCLSYVVLTTLLDGLPTATFDSHFKMMGLPVLSIIS